MIQIPLFFRQKSSFKPDSGILNSWFILCIDSILIAFHHNLRVSNKKWDLIKHLFLEFLFPATVELLDGFVVCPAFDSELWAIDLILIYHTYEICLRTIPINTVFEEHVLILFPYDLFIFLPLYVYKVAMSKWKVLICFTLLNLLLNWINHLFFSNLLLHRLFLYQQFLLLFLRTQLFLFLIILNNLFNKIFLFIKFVNFLNELQMLLFIIDILVFFGNLNYHCLGRFVVKQCSFSFLLFVEELVECLLAEVLVVFQTFN